MKRYFLTAFTTILAACGCYSAYAQNITTVAGGTHSGDSVDARLGYIYPTDVTVDASGTLFVLAYGQSYIKRVDPVSGIMTIYAGVGTAFSYSGDGGPAIAAGFDDPISVTADGLGNIYISDNYRIRKIDAAGIITTIAGTGVAGYSGDGGPATAAQLQRSDIAADAAGNIYVADALNNRIRKISAGIITTIAGIGVTGYDVDGTPALSARLYIRDCIAIDPFGNVIFSDNFFIRKITTAGILVTVAGNGSTSGYYTGDGGPATNADILIEPSSIITDAVGNIYYSDFGTIRKVSTSGIITRYAGTPMTGGVLYYSGDGGPATAATYSGLAGQTMDAAGNLYTADAGAAVVRKVNTAGIISTVAGNNLRAYTGDEGPATAAVLKCTSIVTDTSTGDVYLADVQHLEVRKITPNGIIHRIAGHGGSGTYGDGYSALEAQLGTAFTIAMDKHKNIYIVDNSENLIRKISPAGIITRIAGTGTLGFVDGGPALTAKFAWPYALAADTAGNLYITDVFNYRVRKINVSGTISTVAGTGATGFSGDGGPATSAKLIAPFGIAIDKQGSLLVGDSSRIRKITKAGIITTIAGTGIWGHSGDGGPATAARLGLVVDIKLDDTGNIYFADLDYVRKIDTFGRISTVSGTSIPGFSGDGGPATLAQLREPRSVARDISNNWYIADASNNRIRFICNSDSIVSTATVSRDVSGAVCAGMPITFTATSTNTGPWPSYQWKRNGANIAAATSATYTSSTLANGDVISCVVTSNQPPPCVISNTSVSNNITVAVTPAAPPPSSVSITASPGAISVPGETITFTAAYMNGGTAPTFQWYINGSLVPGATTNPFITNTVANGDQVAVTVFSSVACALPDSASGSFTTGLAAVSGNTVSVDVFPNPSNGSFTIMGDFGSSTKATIELVNLAGSIIYQEHFALTAGKLDAKITSVQATIPGIYILRIISDREVCNYRVTIR